MVRKTVLLLTPVLALALALAFWLTRPQRTAAPNVILICLDTVRYDTFWLVESAGLTDPLSFWLERAVRFRNAHAVSPWTLPSVASVLTGLHPVSHGAGLFPGPLNDLSHQTPTPLKERFPTLVTLLSKAGYRTANFSAQVWTNIPAFGLNRSFDQEYRVKDEELLEEVFRWLLGGGHRSQPFFLNLHLMTAHELHRQPAAVMRHAVESLDQELAAVARPMAPFAFSSRKETDGLKFLAYVRSVAFLRERLARLLATLYEAGLLSRTIVFVYSDHGEEFLDHLEQGVAEAADLRGIYGTGHGHSLFQELLSIPMLAWVPSQTGTDVTYPSSLIDVAPTILSWAGLNHLAPSRDGRDLAPIVAGDASELDWNRPLYASGNRLRPLAQQREIRKLEADPHPGWRGSTLQPGDGPARTAGLPNLRRSHGPAAERSIGPARRPPGSVPAGFVVRATRTSPSLGLHLRLLSLTRIDISS